METLGLIRKWNLNNNLLAEKIGLSPQTFCQKLKGKQKYHYFKPSDLDKLKNVLKELSKDIGMIK